MTTEAAAPPLDEDPLGRAWDEVERYALIQEIARGGGGRISIALDRKLGRRIAVKQPVVAGAGRRLEREALVMARLEHPSIVPVHDAGRDLDGAPFYAMKLLGGPNLSERIRAASTFEQRLGLLRVVGAVADAMAYAHTSGVIHRDLKPANVVVGEFGEVAVIDWGLAKAIGAPDITPASAPLGGDLTTDGDVIGTPAYMAPEQARGEAVDARADVYALGAMLYQVLTGELPYGRVTADEQIARVLAGPPPAVDERAPRVPRELAAIVGKAMARVPDARYPTARELAEDLHRYRDGRLVAAHRYSPWTRARRWMRRRAAWLAGAAALVATGGAIALAVARHDEVESTCVDLDRPAATAWNASARAAIDRAFGAHAPASRAAVERALDDRAAALTAMRTDACRARERGEQSATVVDERMACLDARVGELRAVGGAIAGLGPGELPQAEVLLDAMGSLDECADLRRLRDAPLPTLPALRAEVMAVDERLTALDADDLAGRVRSELAISPALLGRALATGHAPLIAHALEELGAALAANGQTAPAEAVLHAAAIASARAGDDHRRGRALDALAQVLAREHGRVADADALASEAVAIGERLGDRELRAAGLARLAEGAGTAGDVDRAIALARQVVELERAPDAAPIRRAEAQLQLGKHLAQARRFDEARAAVEEALRELRELAGPDHDAIAGALGVLGTMDTFQGHYDAAEKHVREAAEMYERILGPDANQALVLRHTLGEILKMEDRFDDAVAVLDDVRARLQRQPDPNPETLANVEDSLASVFALQTKPEPALAAYRSALGHRADPASRGAGMDRVGAGAMLLLLHHPADALPELVAAAGILEKTDGADGYYTAYAHLEIGEAHLATGDARGALASFARARAGLIAQGDDHDLGQLEFDLAQAAWADGDRAGSAAHVTRARAALETAGADGAHTLHELDAWTATHAR